MRFSYIRKSLRAYRTGKIGDAALYEAAIYRSPSPEVAKQLGDLEGYYPEVDLDKLRKLPEGTLGREYAQFLDKQGIEPFTFSDEAKAEFRQDPYTVRYIVTHDLHHLLSGFDTGMAGELGVFAVSYGQGVLTNRLFLWMAKAIVSLATPTQFRRVLHNCRVGLAIGKRAKLLVGERLEDQFERPLAELRAEYNIPEPTVSGILPSKKSWLFNVLSPSLAGKAA